MVPEPIELKYEPEDDVLNVYFSKKPIDDAYDVEEVDFLAIMHVDKAKKTGLFRNF